MSILALALLALLGVTDADRRAEVVEIAEAIERHAPEYGRSPWRVAALAVKETRVSLSPVGKLGECGPMQVMGWYLEPPRRCNVLQEATGGTLAALDMLRQWETLSKKRMRQRPPWLAYDCFAVGRACLKKTSRRPWRATRRLARIEAQLHGTASAMLATRRAMDSTITIGGRPHESQFLEGLHIEKVRPFFARARTRLTDAIVIHESAGPNPEKRMRANRWGTHFVLHRDGRVCQHNDVLDKLSHATGMNDRSVGIEIVNRYYPKASTPPVAKIDPACWAHKGAYLLPSQAQAEACAAIVGALTNVSIDDPREPGHLGLSVPRLFAGWDPDQERFWLVQKPGAWYHSGVSPHCHSIRPSRADGPFLALYCFLRLAKGLDAIEAWEGAIIAARESRKPSLARL